ncbi:hypothetical protein BBJ28_00021989 [Nothophytophthora sp. Chile5]|nr:hypothetical protein BBJ28_00021989 [Nothophytophthora sp. Chile5]
MDRPGFPPRSADDEAERSAALEDAVALLLRHRLFPRAMAWNVRQNVTPSPSPPPSTEFVVAAAAQALEEQLQRGQEQETSTWFAAPPPEVLQPRFPTTSEGSRASSNVNGAARADALDVARSFPLLQASMGGIRGTEEEENRYRLAMETKARSERRARLRDASPFQSSSIAATIDNTLPPGDARERLFRTMGKYLDGRTSGSAAGSSSGSLGGPSPKGMYVQQTPTYLQPPLTAASQYADALSPDRMTMEQQTAFQAMKISSYAEAEQHSWAELNQQPPPFSGASIKTPPPASSPPVTLESTVGLHQAHPRSSPKTSSTSGKKRTRGSSSASLTASSNEDTIAPSLARALLSGCGAKQCSFEGCKKIAVSKGLCRGHGGGRRCQHAGCTKCAQSRSPFCWAHGGGKRCEAPNCRRSRKTKRFCVDHVDMELTVPMKATNSTSCSTATSSSVSVRFTSAYGSIDSDDSVGKQSTVSCDSSLSAIHNKENKRSATTEYVHQQKRAQYHQYAGELSGVAPPSLQLPSLNEALLRTVPTQSSADVAWSTSTPSPPAPPSSQYKSELRSWPGGTSDEGATGFPSHRTF